MASGRYFPSAQCTVCKGELTLNAVAPTPEARRRLICATCRDLAIDQCLASAGIGASDKTADNHELRESAADHLGLGRAARWRYLTSNAPPGLSTPERRVTLLRYIAETSAARFGLCDFPDEADERYHLDEWSALPKFKAFGLPAYQYGVCLVFPRPPGEGDPRATVRCDMCQSSAEISMPEFVPIPSQYDGWVLRWPWHGGPVTGICSSCRVRADAFEELHRAFG
jgi:hypothetical protein